MVGETISDWTERPGVPRRSGESVRPGHSRLLLGMLTACELLQALFCPGHRPGRSQKPTPSAEGVLEATCVERRGPQPDNRSLGARHLLPVPYTSLAAVVFELLGSTRRFRCVVKHGPRARGSPGVRSTRTFEARDQCGACLGLHPQ